MVSLLEILSLSDLERLYFLLEFILYCLYIWLAAELLKFNECL